MNTIQKDILDKLNKVVEQVKNTDDNEFDLYERDVFSLFNELDWFSQHLKIGEGKNDKEERSK